MRLSPLVHHVSWRGEGKRGNLVHMLVRANTIQGHFAAVECAKFMSLQNLAQQHNDRPAIGTVVGILVVVQRQISQSQTVQNPFVHYSDCVVDVHVTVQMCAPKQ